MKKLVSLLLAATLALGLAACGGGGNSGDSGNGGGAASSDNGENAESSSSSSVELPKSIEVQLPASAGGGTDVVARALTTYINQNSDTNMTIVNNTDGSGVVAMETVRTAKADASKILFFHTTMAIKTATGVYDYSAADDFKLIAYGQSTDPGGYVLVVSADSGIETLDDYIAAANEANGEFTIGIETGGSSHIMAGIAAEQMGVTLKYTDAGADTDKLTSLVGGNINSALVNANQAKQYIEGGMVNALACFSSSDEGGRCSNLPDVPSFKEQGYDCVYGTNFYVLGPKDMSDELAQEICRLFTAAAEDPDTAEILNGAGMGTTFVPYADGPALISAEQEKLNKACADLGLAG